MNAAEQVRWWAAGALRAHLACGEIPPGARLLHDLGLDGDDAWEFMEEFAQRFTVDLRRFPFTRYFHDEGQLIASVNWSTLPSLPLAVGCAVWFRGVPIWAWLLIGVAVNGVVVALWRARVPKRLRHADKLPLTMDDLVRAAGAGQWVSARRVVTERRR